MVGGKIISTNSPYIEREIKKIPLTKNSKILDVGCGIGQYFSLYKGYIWGIDFDDKNLERAKKRFPKAKLLKHDLSKKSLPIKERFDLIVCLDVIEHLNKQDALRLIKELESINEGILLISTPNVNNITSLIRFLIFKNVEIAGKPNSMERLLYRMTKGSSPASNGNKYFIMESGDRFSDKSLHYHVSSFSSSYFKKRNYKVIGGLGFVIHSQIKNKMLRSFLDKFYYYVPYLSGSFLAIKR